MRAIPITSGGEIWLAGAAPLAVCIRAAEHAGYRLTMNHRGRLVAVPLQQL